MGRYVEGSDRTQVMLLPECLDDYIAEDNPVRVVEAFVGELNLKVLGFATGAFCGDREVRRWPRVQVLVAVGYLRQSEIDEVISADGAVQGALRRLENGGLANGSVTPWARASADHSS